MNNSHQSYKSYLNNNIFTNIIVANQTTGENVNLSGIREPLKRDLPKTNKADFIIRLMKYDCPLVRSRSSKIDGIILNNISSEDSLNEIYVTFRKMYEETGEQLSLQLSLLALKLIFFQRLHPDKGDGLLIKPIDYIKLSLSYGSSFTEFLKKLRAYATLSTLGHITFDDLKEKIAELNKNKFKIILDEDRKFNYDDFLSESHLLFWEEDVNDFEWSFKPLEYDDKVIEDSFRYLIRELLTKYKVKQLFTPDASDIATWTSDSSSFEEGDETNSTHKTIVRKRIYEQRKDCFGHLTRDMIFKRSIIPVGPGNFRDSWMPDLDTLFTIKSISHCMRQVIQAIPYSAMYDAQVAHKRKKILRKDGNLFFLLDFKKSGLTINRKLLTVMGEELSRVYPNCKEFEYISYYQNLMVNDNGKDVRPPRGIGLGNANELYTLMQCAIGLSVEKVYKTKSIFFNDDAVYVMHSRLWRRQLSHIISFIKALGLIPNLGKSIVSKSNIFCEEYQIHTEEDEQVLDYSKKQLLILPLASVLFQRTTAAAKRYLYALDRQLIGTGYRNVTLNILEQTQSIYKMEFGKMDYLLPYHLGGWTDFSTSNFSCLVEYMLDPWKYIQNYSDQGLIPEIRRWILYNISISDKEERSILGCRSKISYRSKLKLPFDAGLLFDYNTDLSSYVHGYLGLNTPEIYNIGINNVINYRGLHNAKPKIRAGLDFKEKIRRKNIFEHYRYWKKDNHLSLQRDGLSLGIILESIREIPDKPSYYTYPSCLVTKWIPNLYDPSKKKAIVVKKNVFFKHSSGKILRMVNNTIRSIESGVWFHGSDPFILFDLLQRARSGYLISDKDLRLKYEMVAALPPHYEAFSPNKRLLIADFITKNDKIPIEYQSFSLIPNEYEHLFLEDAFEKILPIDLIGGWRNIKNLYENRFDEIREIVESVNLQERNEFSTFISTLEEILEEELPQKNVIDFYEDDGDDIDDLFKRIEEEELFFKLIMKGYTVEALLEEHVHSDFDSDLAPSQYESDEDPYNVPSDIYDEESQQDSSSEKGYDSFNESDQSNRESDEIQSPYDFFESESNNSGSENEISEQENVEDYNPVSEIADLYSDISHSESETSSESESDEIGDIPIFSKKGIGRGNYRRFRYNFITGEKLNMNNIYDRMEYARMRRRSNRLNYIFDQESSGDETILSLNEIRRLHRQQDAPST